MVVRRLWYVAGLSSSSYGDNYEHFVNESLTPYISTARNIAIATTVAAAVVIVTVIVGRLLGRAWLRRLKNMSTNNTLNSFTAADNAIDQGRSEGHLDDLCECHVTSAVTSPSAGPLLHPSNYSETIV